MGLLTPINKNILNSILNYVKSRYIKILDTANTASGTNTATLNTIDGVVNFSSTVKAASSRGYTITNSLITSSSVINWGVIYVYNDTEIMLTGTYQPENGSATFVIYNAGDTESNTDGLKIWFKIIG